MTEREVILPEILAENETARYIGANQPYRREFRVRCACGGLGDVNTVFFSEEERKKAVEAIPEERKLDAILFFHHASSWRDDFEIIGRCGECKKALRAEVEIV